MQWKPLLYLILASPVAGYALYLYIVHRLKKWLRETAEKGPAYPESHDAMTSIVKSKPEESMTEEDFTVKYSAFRHVFYMGSGMTEQRLTTLNRILQPIEVYLMHGGYSALETSASIDRPIFIIGDFRSGTSVLERVIAKHPSVCHFTTSHSFVWSAPGLWDSITAFMRKLRKEAVGFESWNRPGGEGIYYPHSSNNLLTLAHPFELESAWSFSKGSLLDDRHYNWDTLDSEKLNPDNTSNCDVMTEFTDDPYFEQLWKTAVRCIIKDYVSKHSDQRGKVRFINKNPLNGFRIGFLKKMFPDAKFVHIRRNPAKTLKSQLLMQRSMNRAFYIRDEQSWRKHNMQMPMSQNYQDFLKDGDFSKVKRDEWEFLMHGHFPNDFIKQLWWPRVFPRTVPEHYEIQKHLKEGKVECAHATAVVQHERVALDAYERLGMIEDKDVMFVFHEDLIEDATLTAERVFAFLDLKVTKEEVISILESEDFPNGQANKERSKRSGQRNVLHFGDNTAECLEILKPVIKRFNLRKPVHERFKEE